MTLRTIQAQFSGADTGFQNPISNFLNSLGDTIAGAGSTAFPTWTTGRSMINSIGQQSLGSKPFNVIGFSVSAYLLYYAQASTTQNVYGKFGKIVAGLTTSPTLVSNTSTPGAGALSFLSVDGIHGLPADQTMLSDLWDPSVDRLPPGTLGPATLETYSSLLPVSCQVSLPQPVTMQAGSNFSVGWWQFPSLISAALQTIIVLGAQYSIALDTLDAGNPTWSPVY